MCHIRNGVMKYFSKLYQDSRGKGLGLNVAEQSIGNKLGLWPDYFRLHLEVFVHGNERLDLTFNREGRGV